MLKRLWRNLRDNLSKPATHDSAAGPCRLLFIANSPLPTLDIYFLRPLEKFVTDGVVSVFLLTEQELHARFGQAVESNEALGHWLALLDDVRPHALVFCRYSGPHAEALMRWAKTSGTPTILHLDDDLLDVPPELGPVKFRFHNDPVRKARVRMLMDACDVVYASTEVLAEHLQGHGPRAPVRFAAHALAGEVLAPHSPADAATVVGYMSGSDHARDLALVLPAVVSLLDRHAGVRFELWGATAVAPDLHRFGDRVRVTRGVVGYAAFVEAFRRSGWHIGLCPLAATPFNAAKSCIKWIECTAVGAVVVATRGLAYDACCADDCGILVPNEASAWLEAMDELVRDPQRRRALAGRAQQRLANDYSSTAQRRQVIELLQSVGVAWREPVDGAGTHR